MTFLQVVVCEFRAFFSNVSVMFVVIVGSILYAFLYPTPYYADIVRKQRIVVVDKDNTSLSKDFIFLVNNADNLQVAYITDSDQRAKELLEKNEVYGQLNIPSGFERSINKGVPVELLYRADASYFLIYGTIIEGLNNVGTYFSNEIKMKRNEQLGKSSAGNNDTLVHFVSIPLFNPSIGYINYALAAILVFILHQTLLAGIMIQSAGQNIERRRLLDSKLDSKNIIESGTFIESKQNLDSKNSIESNFQDSKDSKLPYFIKAPIFHLISARIFTFSIIYVVLFLIYFGVFFKIYGINTTANSFEFWCFGLMFIMGSASFGVMLGTFMYSKSLPTQIILISSMPLVFMMGFIYPIMLLPEILQVLIQVVPAFHGINGFLRLNQMSDTLNAIMPHFYALFIIFWLCFLVSYMRYKRLRNKERILL